MKKVLFVLAISVLAFSCIKSDKGCEAIKPSAEEAQIVAYAAASGITATKDPSGIFYQIIEEGAGASPTVQDTVSVTYTGKFLNGAIFDQSSSAITFPLNRVIEGWQIVMPKIKKGGRVKMILPSAYAYGCTGYAPKIGGNEILFFDVTLVDVK